MTYFRHFRRKTMIGIGMDLTDGQPTPPRNLSLVLLKSGMKYRDFDHRLVISLEIYLSIQEQISVRISPSWYLQWSWTREWHNAILLMTCDVIPVAWNQLKYLETWNRRQQIPIRKTRNNLQSENPPFVFQKWANSQEWWLIDSTHPSIFQDMRKIYCCWVLLGSEDHHVVQTSCHMDSEDCVCVAQYLRIKVIIMIFLPWLGWTNDPECDPKKIMSWQDTNPRGEWTFVLKYWKWRNPVSSSASNDIICFLLLLARIIIVASSSSLSLIPQIENIIGDEREEQKVAWIHYRILQHSGCFSPNLHGFKSIWHLDSVIMINWRRNPNNTTMITLDWNHHDFRETEWNTRCNSSAAASVWLQN